MNDYAWLHKFKITQNQIAIIILISNFVILIHLILECKHYVLFVIHISKPLVEISSQFDPITSYTGYEVSNSIISIFHDLVCLNASVGVFSYYYANLQKEL